MGNKSGPGLTLEDFLIAFLIALGVGIAGFTITAVAGYLITERIAPEQPSTAPQTVQAASSSRATTSASSSRSVNSREETSNGSETEQTAEPAQQETMSETEPSQAVQAETTEPSKALAATPSAGQTQSQSPTVSTQPEPKATAEPSQSSEQSGNGGGNSTSYSRENWPSGKYLGSNLSDKYHSHNCRAAATILPENEIWFNSEDEAQSTGYSRCGICW